MREVKRKFETGRIIISPSVQGRMNNDISYKRFVILSLGKHTLGDWGDSTEEDKLFNDAAVKDGGRLMSVYNRAVQNPEDRLLIVTERGRFATTICYPDEY